MAIELRRMGYLEFNEEISDRKMIYILKNQFPVFYEKTIFYKVFFEKTTVFNVTKNKQNYCSD